MEKDLQDRHASISLEEKWVFFTCPMRLFLSHAIKTLVALDKNNCKSWLQNPIFLLVHAPYYDVATMTSKVLLASLIQGYQRTLSSNITLLGVQDLDGIGPVDLVILGWSC